MEYFVNYFRPSRRATVFHRVSAPQPEFTFRVLIKKVSVNVLQTMNFSKLMRIHSATFMLHIFQFGTAPRGRTSGLARTPSRTSSLGVEGPPRRSGGS